jgi:biotin carboxyl carrier protein/RNA polymerase subunit RPABC4/transcription elongation factor Spt4
MRVCNKCSLEFDDNVKFCSECGSKTDAYSASLICPSCNTLVNEGVKFCPECGDKTGHSVGVTSSITPPPLFSVPAPNLSSVLISDQISVTPYKVIEIIVPYIGDFKNVKVIKLLVKIGDFVQKDQSLVEVESDKACMEIPSSHAGVIKAWRAKVGDIVNSGSVILLLELVELNPNWLAVRCPILSKDITQVTVSAVKVELGSEVKLDQILFELETDKVVLEIPSPVKGVVRSIPITKADKVIQDQILCFVENMN